MWPSSVQAATLDVLYDDGIAVWINGAQVFINNVDGVAYSDWASSTLPDNQTASTAVSPSVFVDGLNIISAEDLDDAAQKAVAAL